MLTRSLGLERARLVSLCGAGGKTTLMFALAREYVAAGERVLLTTTTKIAREEAAGPWPAFAAPDAQGILDIARRLADQASGQPSAFIVYSGASEAVERLTGFAPELIDSLKSAPHVDRILVEADGSARKPLKAPAAHEPVIPASTDAVIVVAGLNGLGRSLCAENLFRPELWARLTGAALGSAVTAESLATMAAHGEGLTRGCPEHASRILFLNQADTPERRAAAERVCERIAAAPPGKLDRVVAGWLLPAPAIVTVAELSRAERRPPPGD